VRHYGSFINKLIVNFANEQLVVENSLRLAGCYRTKRTEPAQQDVSSSEASDKETNVLPARHFMGVMILPIMACQWVAAILFFFVCALYIVAGFFDFRQLNKDLYEAYGCDVQLRRRSQPSENQVCVAGVPVTGVLLQ
jgi:hypothetical protein